MLCIILCANTMHFSNLSTSINVMEIEFEKSTLPENYGKVVAAACWGHCCVHGGYGNDEW